MNKIPNNIKGNMYCDCLIFFPQERKFRSVGVGENTISCLLKKYEFNVPAFHQELKPKRCNIQLNQEHFAVFVCNECGVENIE